MFSIIIVDDNRLVSEGIRELVDWESLGVEVAGICDNGLEGYKMAMKLKPDFVISDVDMPVMDGLEMAAKIKDALLETKFIFISCFDDFNYVKEAMDLEAYKYILKPINFDELTSVIQKLSKLKNQNLIQKGVENELKLQVRRSIPLLQQQFFKDLLYGRLTDEEDILAHMRYLGIERVNQYYTVVFVEVDDYELKYSGVDIEKKYLIIEGIKKYINELMLFKDNGYIINQQHNSLGFIIYTPNNKDEELSSILEALSLCKGSINNKLNVNITFGVSEFSVNIKNMPKLLEYAEYAVKSKFYSRGNTIIMSSDIKDFSEFEHYNLQILRNDIKEIFVNEKKELIDTFINKYYMTNTHLPQNYIKSLTFSIVNIIHTILIEENQSFENVFQSETAIWEKISRFETIVDIEQWISYLFKEVISYLSNKESNRYKKIVEDIKRIVGKNYAEVNNIEEIIKPLFISASHANLIFKQKTGMTIFDYLVDTRMEQAKKMLEDPYSKVYEVSEKVGYKNKSYFSSIFKEYTGLTPKQYTNRNSK